MISEPAWSGAKCSILPGYRYCPALLGIIHNSRGISTGIHNSRPEHSTQADPRFGAAQPEIFGIWVMVRPVSAVPGGLRCSLRGASAAFWAPGGCSGGGWAAVRARCSVCARCSVRTQCIIWSSVCVQCSVCVRCSVEQTFIFSHSSAVLSYPCRTAYTYTTTLSSASRATRSATA